MRPASSLATLLASLLIATASSFAADSAPKATPFDQAQALMDSLLAKALRGILPGGGGSSSGGSSGTTQPTQPSSPSNNPLGGAVRGLFGR